MVKLDFNQILALVPLSREQLTILPVVDSTMVYASQRRFSGMHVIAAEQQTAGQGQRGHHFQSPDGGIYLTLVVPVKQQFLQQPGLLTIGVGVAVRTAIVRILKVAPELKWVNDLFLQGQKCGGVLTKLQTNTANQPTAIMIGIGLNLGPNPALQTVQATNLAPDTRLKNELVAELCKQVLAFYRRPVADEVRQQYQAHLLWRQCLVQIKNHDRYVTGYLQGITPNFELQLQTATGTDCLVTAAASQHLHLISAR
ncbi:Biotin-, acetyl-CoA carboxylase ligase [Fructilactobacillus florum 8D]|uniref:Biotin-, acetyl-CoA carboxylase ligase n=1 Tax=Fructilactobacillus florum 8D TaxID=1221538 RepID=W9EE17_9LACO|nr:biotin--[acetyl-CoA-carboxylase] ligase [Fructilactobacillus florum]ETO40373.1 Biotin-, acetyl-CoA carboxylase ligase [Fructilactobacillus florum 8D]